MGNLADKRRLRKERDKQIYDGDIVISEKDEHMYIPFVKRGNDDTRPWIYKGFYRMPDGNIDMEMIRMDGHIELKMNGVDNHKEYMGRAVGEFIDKVYKESPHEAETVSLKEHETETDLLKKEIARLHDRHEKDKEIVERFRGIMENIE